MQRSVSDILVSVRVSTDGSSSQGLDSDAVQRSISICLCLSGSVVVVLQVPVVVVLQVPDDAWLW